MRNRFKIVFALLAIAIMGYAASVFYRTAGEIGLEKTLFSELLSLANKGDSEAQYHIGMMYNNGIGTDVNYGKAFDWFNMAMESGNPLGAFKLGCYYDGQFQGIVKVDHELGLKYKLVAAEQGYDLAQSSVAQHYFVSNNFAEAVRWWTAAAKQGEPSAMYRLSSIYSHGEIAKTDLPLSYRYLDALKRMPDFSSDQSIEEAHISLIAKMEPTDIAAAKNGAPFVEEPTALTLKARAGITEAEKYLASSIR